MAKARYDTVIEAVHYAPNGQIAWVRGYERRGAIFSDRVMIGRAALIERLKARKRIVAGRRIPYQASTFEVSHPLRVIRRGGSDVLVTGDSQADRDWLEGVPVI